MQFLPAKTQPPTERLQINHVLDGKDSDFVMNVLPLAPTRARPGSKHTLTVGFDQNGCIYARLKSDDRGDEHSGYLEPAPRKR